MGRHSGYYLLYWYHPYYTSDMATKCTWNILEDTWGSDRHPIIIELDQKCLCNSFKPTPHWSMKKANWDKFQTACDEFITEPDKTSNIEDTYNTYIDQLTKAINCSIPKTNPNKTTKTPTSRWNEDCTKAITNRKEPQWSSQWPYNLQTYLCYCT